LVLQLATQIADTLWLMTEENIITGKPSDLIESDKINLLFDSKSIYFDKESKQFIMH